MDDIALTAPAADVIDISTLPVDDKGFVALPAGNIESVAVQTPGDVFGISISFDITKHLDPNIEIEIEAWLSNDGGETWDFGGSARRMGGITVNPVTGNRETQAGFTCVIQKPGYDKNNKFTGYVPKWQDPLVKTITKVVGGQFTSKFAQNPVQILTTQADVPDLHHSITVVQSVSATGSAVAAVTTPGITTTSTNLVITDGYYYNIGDFFAISDNYSNAWSASVSDHGNPVVAFQKYNASINGGGGHTFSLTLVRQDYPTIAVTEVSGHSASPLDKTALVDDGAGTSHTTASTGTLSQAKELAMGMGGAGSTSTLSVSAPWTQRENISHDGTHEGIITAYQIVNATTALTFTYATGSSVLANGHITTWKEATATSVVGKGFAEVFG